MDTVRCKFRVTQVQEPTSGSGGTGTILATPVQHNSGDSENSKFWSATPNGELRLNIDSNNTDAMSFFHQGEEIYLDITPVQGQGQRQKQHA